MAVTTATNLDYLIPMVRFYIGDQDETRYTDDWMQTSLQASITALMPWWKNKYLLDTDNNVSRNTEDWKYILTSPPLIQNTDEAPVVLMAAYLTMQGSLEEFSWNLGRWRDAEISYSNIEGGKHKDKMIERIWNVLMLYLLPPTKKLKNSLKGDLPGYRGNRYESAVDY